MTQYAMKEAMHLVEPEPAETGFIHRLIPRDAIKHLWAKSYILQNSLWLVHVSQCQIGLEFKKRTYIYSVILSRNIHHRAYLPVYGRMEIMIVLMRKTEDGKGTAIVFLRHLLRLQVNERLKNPRLWSINVSPHSQFQMSLTDNPLHWQGGRDYLLLQQDVQMIWVC